MKISKLAVILIALLSFAAGLGVGLSLDCDISNADPAVVASGTDGNIDWVVTSDGTLTLSGDGIIPDYTASARPPWFVHAGTIINLVVEEGITLVGAYAFSDLYRLVSVSLPDGLTRLGSYAFRNCYTLQSVHIPSSVTSSGGTGVFSGCHALSDVVLSSVPISKLQFEKCYSLTSLTIPAGVTNIGNDSFYDCYSLTTLRLCDGHLVNMIGSSSWTTGGFYDPYNVNHIIFDWSPSLSASVSNFWAPYPPRSDAVLSLTSDTVGTTGGTFYGVDGTTVLLGAARAGWSYTQFEGSWYAFAPFVEGVIDDNGDNEDNGQVVDDSEDFSLVDFVRSNLLMLSFVAGVLIVLAILLRK